MRCAAPPCRRLSLAPRVIWTQFVTLPEQRLAAAAVSGRLQEWEFLLGLRHPAVLPCVHAFEAPSPANAFCVVCMITPQGDCDLGAAIEARWSNTAFDGHVSVPERLQLAAQLCAGLAYLHEHRVAHRDIKPGNVLLAGRALLLADLGLAKEIDPVAASAHHTAIGTAEYAVRVQHEGTRAQRRVLTLGTTCGCATGARGIPRRVLPPRGRLVAGSAAY